MARALRVAPLLNRFRREDTEKAERRGRPAERVQSVLAVSDVLKVQSQGLNRADKDLVLSVLSISFEPGEDGTGRVIITPPHVRIPFTGPVRLR